MTKKCLNCEWFKKDFRCHALPPIAVFTGGSYDIRDLKFIAYPKVDPEGICKYWEKRKRRD